MTKQAELTFENMPDDFIVFESFLNGIGRLDTDENIMCSISGGSDSDIVLDFLYQNGMVDKVHFVFFDTGLEYQATKEHLEYLEHRYNITINREKAKKPIPLCCRQFGQPFLSKAVSEKIQRLQKHGFRWEDEPIDVLIKRYPNCKASLRWWCNDWGEESRFNISNNKGLKEFMIANPPDFAISNLCCNWAKKKVAEDFKKDHDIALSITGIRKAEGGARASAYKSCFGTNAKGMVEYRPIFWYKDENKRAYEDYYHVQHSRCYTEYGMKRTGCAGCPFGRDFENELEIIEKYEPKLYKAVNKIFRDSYEYTRKYRDYLKRGR